MEHRLTIRKLILVSLVWCGQACFWRAPTVQAAQERELPDQEIGPRLYQYGAGRPINSHAKGEILVCLWL
jgi:hypothetical protein